MTTPSYAELVAVVRHQGAALAGTGQLGLNEPVPSCPGWDVGRLLLHTGRVYRYAASIVETRATAAPERPAPPDEGTDAIEYLLDSLDEIVTVLGETPAETPVWNWSSSPDVAAFWARRMAHESLIHRVDGQLAHDVPPLIPVDLAVDCIDELLGTILPRVIEREEVSFDGTVHVQATDGGARWTAKLTPGSVAVTRGPGSADLTLSGKASELLLLLYNRADVQGVDVQGDDALLQQWREKIKV